MPSLDHPILLIVAAAVSIAATFPVARFFFDDFETFKQEFGLSRQWERELWLLGLLPNSPMVYFKIVGFIGALGILFVAVYSLGLRLIGP